MLLDTRQIDELRQLDGSGDLLKELVAAFLDDAPQRMQELEQALAANDADIAHRASHTLKGSCSNFGLTELHEAALVVMRPAKAGDLASASAAMPALRAAYDRALEALKPYG